MEEVHQEMRVRRRLAGLFNKAPNEFGSKEDYDAYLEMVEEHVYNLANKVDVAATEEKLKEYERANRDSIYANQARQAEAKRQPSQAAAASQVAFAADAATTSAPVASYMPAASAPMGSMQPRPMGPVSVDASGSLIAIKAGPPHADAGRAMTAGGWDPEIARRRVLHDALSSVFAC